MIEKYCRIETEEGARWGRLSGESVNLITGAPYEGYRLREEVYELKNTRLLAPVTPTKIVCVGLNYAEHVKESQSASEVPDEPVLFLKPPSALIEHEGTILRPRQSQRVDYEAEIGVVLGARLRNATPTEAEDAIFGVTCVNDVTARDLQKKDVQWTRGKGFDTFCPVGPFLVTGLDYLQLNVSSRLNGELRQNSNSCYMVFSIPELISFMST